MDEARAVLRRLDRIYALEDDAEPLALLGELRALLHEAEAWVRIDRDERALDAVDALRAALARDRATVGA
jgi:hypothetical protein